MRPPRAAHLAAALALLAAVFVSAPSARAQNTLDRPPEVDVEERLNDRVPMDLAFRDHEGRPVRLRDVAGRGRPTLLVLQYFRCPMLCSLVVNGLVAGLRQLPYRVGQDYDLVSVSFDPDDRVDVARAKRANYLRSLGRASDPSAWPFLTGGSQEIRQLTAAVGFRYQSQGEQFAHPAVVMVLTPDGRIGRYLYGVQFAPSDLRLTLVEAGRGRIGTTLDRVVLRCFRYDPSRRRYTPYVLGMVRVGAGVMTLVVAGMIGTFLVRERRRRAKP